MVNLLVKILYERIGEMMVKVSIIIPVYNAEEYIETCLESINMQTFRNFEVILVDDGSKDKSKNICESFCQMYPKQFKYYWQENSGVSAARNLGIDKAMGEWIMFIDADDTISDLAIDQLLKSIDEEHDDLVISGYTRRLDGFSVSNVSTSYSSNSLIKLLLNSPNYQRMYLELGNLFDDIVLMTVWGKLYRRSIVKANSLKFNIYLKVCEDVVFNYEYFRYVRNAIFSHSILYYYRIAEGSASTKIDKSRIVNLYNLIEEMLRFRDLHSSDLQRDITVYCCKMIVIWYRKIKHNAELKKYFIVCVREYKEILSDCRITEKFSKGMKQNVVYKLDCYNLQREINKSIRTI